MQPLWLNVQYSLCARRGGASGLLSDTGFFSSKDDPYARVRVLVCVWDEG